MLPQSFFQRPAPLVAQQLLGCCLVCTTSSAQLAGIIVETEAYTQADQASHSFNGQTPRNSVMFGPAGHAYVYFTCGIHYCLNVVTGEEGDGEAVLIRAVKPTNGIDSMSSRRRMTEVSNLCNGPAKLTQAFGIDMRYNGADLQSDSLYIRPRASEPAVIATPRIGITKATNKLWRFYIKDSHFVSSSKFNHKHV